MKDYSILKNNQTIIHKYSHWLKLQEYSDETIKNKLVLLHPFFRFLNFKNAEQITKQDVEEYILSIKRVKKQNTVHHYRIELKFFFNWLKPENNFFSDITTRMEKNKLPAELILNPEEIMKIIKSTRNQRDRALIFTIYDSAARLDEILSLKIKDVQFDSYGATIKVHGKTGERIIRIIDSVPDLQLWVNQYQGNENDFLFPKLPEKTKFSKNGTRNMLTAACKRAGIKKKVYPHLLRHSKITHLSKAGMNEMQLRIFAGWEKDSNTPAIYLHLSGQDVENKIFEINGIKPIEQKQEIKPSIKICPRCQTKNTFDTVYCRTCSMILDQNIAQEKEHFEKKKFIDYQHNMEIRILEMEMISKIQPYEFQIEKDREELIFLNFTLKSPSSDDHGYAKAKIKELEAEILKFTEKINLIKSEYQNKINFIKS